MKQDKINSMKDVISIACEYSNTEEDIQNCLERLEKITEVPKKTANEFSREFGENGNLTKYEAVKNLIQYVQSKNMEK